MDISILLATYKRPELLRQELESFCKMNTKDISFEILVADNADDAETLKVVESFQDRLSVKYFVEKKQGKNSALNRIIPEAKGNIFIFTDDDVVSDKNWLKEVYAGVQRFPDYSMFGGRVFPYKPEIIPEELKELKRYMHIYGVADWGDRDKEYDAGDIYGTNMIVRSEIFSKGQKFNENVGPRGDSYVPGSETEFLNKIQSLGHKAMYLCGAVVYHQIRQEQCEWEWVLGRAFRDGRARTWFKTNIALPFVFGVPRYLYRAVVENFLYVSFCWIFRKNEYKEGRYELECLKGQIFQYWKMGRS